MSVAPNSKKASTDTEITFPCALCEFHSTDENDFIKHARTHHRTDHSFWCKECKKCFSSAGILVLHIKEGDCVKENMIYRCGENKCRFESSDGQAFILHVRQCNRGNPFIHCVHCPNIFTVPHCLVLHMQSECEHKEKNRIISSEPTPAKIEKHAMPVSTSVSKVTQGTTSASKVAPVTTSAMKATPITTSASKATAVTTSENTATSMSTSATKAISVSTSTRKGTLVSTSARKETSVSTSARKETSVSTSARKETSVSTSARKETSVRTSARKETPVSTSTHKETSVSTSTNKTPPHVMQTSVEQKPCLADAPRTLPAVPVASVVASPREVSNLQGYTSMKGHCTQNSGIDYFDSDSDDPDDPSWCPEETSQSRPLRQSANLASEITDIKNLDLGKSDLLTNKSRNSFEQPVSKTVTCPCCDFSTVLESLLREHYVASHKHTKENSCLICNRKFEHVDLFTQHFYLHEKDIVLSEEDISESSNDSSKLESIVKDKPDEKMSKSSKLYNNILLECIPGKAAEVLGPSVLQISNQTARQEKLAKKSKVKSFEDLKSNTAVVKMQSEPKLKHFFKCTVLNCTFTTDDDMFYLGHLNERHKAKKLHCTYCFQEFSEAQVLIEHMVQEHIMCSYQCSTCFYRAVSKPHVQIHIRNNHKTEKACVYTCSLHLQSNYNLLKESTTNLVTTYPYICSVGDCKYQSFHTKEFTKHTDSNHQNVSQLPCHYCQHDFLSLKQLLRHYQLHDINTFQCNHCVHGSESKEEILLHICNDHFDKPFKIFVRDSQQVELCKTPVNGIVKQNPLPVAKVLPAKVMTVEQHEESLPSPPSFQINQLEYPEEVLLVNKYFFCRMPYCEKECQNFDTYFIHLIEDHSALNILCPYCPTICKNSAVFENHVMCHGPNLYACPSDGCIVYSFLKTSITKHLKFFHKVQSEAIIIREDPNRKLDRLKLTSFPKSESKTDFSICPFCFYESTDSKLMKNHIYAELFYRPFTCNICKEKLCSYSETKFHFAVSHQHQDVKFEGTGNLEIEFLTKAFLTSDVQSKFMECFKSKGIGEEDSLNIMSEYKCEECNLYYKDIANWQYHWVDCVLKENRPNMCNYCSEQFSYMNQLKHHTEKVHAGHCISYTQTENILLRQTTLRKLQFGKLQILKSMLIPFLKSRGLYCEKLNSFQLDFKWRSHLNDKFPCNVQKHISSCHKFKSSVDSEVQNSVHIPKNCNNESKMILVDSCAKTQAKKEPFICAFCDGKMQTMDELEQHVTSFHDTAATDSYSFYHLPHPKSNYSEKDTELYECAYCNVNPANLFHLKRHHVNFHPNVPFKILGKRFKDPPTIHCDLKVEEEVLEKHFLFHHFEKSTKSLNNNKQQLKRKVTDNVNGPLNKRLKGNSSKYQCEYCEESFQFYFQMITHHRAEHADMPLEFTKDSDSKCEDAQLISCDFCSYHGDERLMDAHLYTKHKNCFVCAYCGNAFSKTSKIVDHIKTEHPHVPIKLVKVGDLSLLNTPVEGSTSYSVHHGGNKSFSNNDCKPQSIDMRNIKVNFPSGMSSTNDPFHIDLMYPVILIEDFAKSYVWQ